MTDITRRIDEIIAMRQRKLPAVNAAIERLEHTVSVVRSIEQIQNDLRSENSRFHSLFSDPETATRLQSISLKQFYDVSDAYRVQLKRLQSRFERKHLHISLVGSARQGKSLVIQKISGLDKDIIPSSDGSDCTGARSVITNTANDAVEAQITFFNEAELCEIVNRYVKGICRECSGISSLSMLSSIPLDELKKAAEKNAEKQQLLRHLKNYIDQVPSLMDRLGRVIIVPKNEIEQYVAQYHHNDPTIKYWNYLAVKGADIKCRFPYGDAGKIVLLDTIGIGATSLGVEESMLQTVRDDSDAIVFMFRPDPLGPRISDLEIKAIDKISDAVSKEYAQEMLFWVINKVEEGKGANIAHIGCVIEQINDGDYPVSEILQVNCSKQPEVEQQLLLPILSKMSQRIDKVDTLLADRVQKNAERVYDEFMKISRAFDDVRCKTASKEIRREMHPIIKRTYERLLNEVRDLYIQKYNRLREEPCQKLQEAAKETLRRMFSFVPSEQDILELLNQGTINQHNAIEKSTNRIRLEIIDAFSSLDTTLSELVSEMKTEVLSIFTDDSKGRLSLVAGNVSDPAEWIEGFLEKTKGDTEYPVISAALRAFNAFQCSVQGFLIYEVRNKLDRIDYSLQSQMPRLRHGLENKEKLASEIYTILINEIEEVHNSIESALFALYKIPNRAMFAAIKDLYDRCAYEDRKDRTEVGVAYEWEQLYETWIQDIWRDEYASKQSAQVNAAEINKLSDEITQCAKKAYFEIAI